MRTRRRASTAVRGPLKGFAEPRKNSGLLWDIRRHVVDQGIVNEDEGRERHKIHVSELVKSEWCPRRGYYRLTDVEPTDSGKSHSYRLETIWAAGHETHAKWQRWLREMGVLWGRWRCEECGFEFEATSPESCGGILADGSVCHSKLLKYAEVNLEASELPLVGHADGAAEDVLVEVKSFAVGTIRIEAPDMVRRATVETTDGKTIVDEAALWKSLVRPLKSHLRQGQMYLWLAQSMGLPYTKIVFIYEWKANQDTKQFEVSYSDRVTRPMVAEVERLDHDVRSGTLPPRPVGFEKTGTPCKDCPWKTRCWKEDGDDGPQEASGVRTRRRVARRPATDGTAADLPAQAAGTRVPRHPRRPDRDDRRRPDAVDDVADEVGGVPRDAVGVRRGRRAARGDGDGEGARARHSVRRPERDRAEGEGVRVRRVQRRS